MHSLTHSFAHQRRIGASFGQTLRIPLSHHRRLRCEKTPLTVAAAAPSMVAIASSAVVNPVQSLVGGLTIGLAVAAKLATTGRVTGISGIYSGLLRGSLDTWRISFIGGLLAGGALLAKLLPSAFATAFPATFTTTRAVVAGLLVGAGSSMGSGCTSGHGVCGLARLSARSLAAVLTFMATGAVTATVFDTAAAVGAAVPTWPSVFSLAAVADPQALQLASVGGIAVVAIAIILGAVRTLMPTAIRADVAEFASGTIFALGLGVGGMLQPSKVAAFLSPAGALFDPSLMAVMGGALLITTPAFQFFTRMNKSPSCASNLSLPSATNVDTWLLLGSAIFGAGWGLAGTCPGPALVNLVHPTPQGVAFVAAMSAGMLLHPALSHMVNSSVEKKVV